ncbi:MAG: hypothetical protein JWN20_2017, partial [Jatrophihabitantaceae bacterium]|nr:hypothetical protein [Jatrophihabitantaceae bacterium]
MKPPRWLTRPRGYALLGEVWPGGSARSATGGVVIGPTGLLERILSGAEGELRAQLPADLRVLGGAGRWIGPAVIDAHVHLSLAAGATARDALGAIGPGLAGVRDLG